MKTNGQPEKDAFRQTLLDSLPFPALLIDRNRIVLAANRIAVEMGARVGLSCWKEFGKSPEEPESGPLPGPEEAGAITSFCRFCCAHEALSSGMSVRHPEVRVGKTVWDMHWIPVDENRYLHYAIDVTERKAVEEALRESRDGLEGMVRERTRALEETMGRLEKELADRRRTEKALRRSEARLAEAQRIARMGHWAWNIGENTLFWSDEIHRLFGFEAGAFEGTYEAFLEAVHPDDREGVERAVDEALAGRKPYAIDHRIVRPDGTERVVHEQGRVFRDEGGKPHRMVGTVQDVTETWRAEETRKVQWARFLAIFENFPEFLYVSDPRTNEVLFTNRRLEEAIGESAVGKKCYEVLQGFTDPCPFCTNEIILSERKPYVWEQFNENLKRHFLVTDQIIQWPDGRDVRFEVAVDITDRKTLEERLLQAQKMEAVGQLAGGVAHDFNNLLTAILGHAERAHRKTVPEDPLRVEVEQIRKAGQIAASLTRQLLAFSHRQTMDLRVLDLHEVVENIAIMLERLLGDDIVLETRTAGDSRLVKADPAQMEQVLINLAVNARDAMPEGGSLLAETSLTELDEAEASRRPGMEAGSYVVLSVTDTGVGMDDQVRSRLFEPFFTTKEAGKGTGLGLSTVYGVVRQLGGHVEVYSEPGHGSTFRVYLPRVEADAGEKTAVASPSEGPGGVETILLAEDEDVVREMTRLELQDLGYTVLEAEGGLEALDRARACAETIDLLITDIMMPGMGGAELFEKLVCDRPDLRAVFISGFPEATVLQTDGLPEGSVYLEKPFTTESLAKAVRETLDGGKG